MPRSAPLLTLVLALVLTLFPALAPAQESHRHGAPEHLGTVRFNAACAPEVLPAFDRAVALLHSFAYDEADAAFAEVATRDPRCALAHWGRAMALYHPLWEPLSAEALAAGARSNEGPVVTHRPSIRRGVRRR